MLALGEIHQQPETVLPILVQLLDNPQDSQHANIIRENALISLRQFGPRAKPAIPTLLKVFETADANFRYEITNALLVIDTETPVRQK